MEIKTYETIKNRIKKNVKLNNGYQFEDLYHETIIKLLISQNKDKKTDNECIKMCVIVALNIIRDYHRKCKTLKEIQLFEEPEQAKSDRLEVIKPIKYREIFTLRYKMKMTYKEIEKFLNIPMGTVKVRIMNMHKELKALNS